MGFNPGGGANDGVTSIVVDDADRILVGGFFESFDGSYRRGLVRLESDGRVRSMFDPDAAVVGGVHGLLPVSRSRYIAVGAFSAKGGATGDGIAALREIEVAR